ncbi:Orn/Lys/Arg decarboxylase N-terminal domain-containing protein, partial [Salmonella enterica]
MSELKIAVSRHCPDCFSTHRNIVNVDESRFIDVAAIVLSIDDIEHGKLDEIDA